MLPFPSLCPPCREKEECECEKNVLPSPPHPPLYLTIFFVMSHFWFSFPADPFSFWDSGQAFSFPISPLPCHVKYPPPPLPAMSLSSLYQFTTDTTPPSLSKSTMVRPKTASSLFTFLASSTSYARKSKKWPRPNLHILRRHDLSSGASALNLNRRREDKGGGVP